MLISTFEADTNGSTESTVTEGRCQVTDQETLEKLHQTLMEKGLTVAVAESLTGGRIAALLTSLPGASKSFVGSVTAYNLDAKVRLLGVDREHAEQCNCVSSRVATEMAVGVRERFGAYIGVATTGYAEPDPSRGVECPYAHIAVVIGEYAVEVRRSVRGSRNRVQDEIAWSAIHHLFNEVQLHDAPDFTVTPYLGWDEDER